jgi:pimeloyl-ACP methyl ester carboxylesterase
VLAEFITSLGLWEIDLVGHDTGGAIAQILAARCPQRLRTLTLTNCETQDNIPPAAMASTVELARTGQLIAAASAIIGNPVAARAFFETGYQNPEFLTTDLVEAFLDPVLGTRESAGRFQELIANLGPAELLESEPALRQLDVPTLIVWGTDDEFLTSSGPTGSRAKFDLRESELLGALVEQGECLTDHTGVGEARPPARCPAGGRERGRTP